MLSHLLKMKAKTKKKVKKYLSNSFVGVYYTAMIVNIFLAGFALFFVFDITDKLSDVPMEISDNISVCYNLSLSYTAGCLNDYVRSIYNYTEQDDTRDMTLEELKAEGGDCRDWAFLYKELAEEVGYTAETFRFSTGKDTAHRIAFIISEEGYCLMDQKSYKCFYY